MRHFYLFTFLTLLSFSLTAQKAKSKKDETKKEEVKEDNKLKSEYYSGLKFRSIGPAVTSGRIADFAVNPNNFSEYYVAVASGGVWKTTNHGVTYQPIFDGEGSYSIGCVTLDPSNTSTVWVGTGENNNQRSVAYGDGVYKSEDGGASWKNVGLKTSEHIADIVVHPKNSNIVYVAAYGPVWKEGGERGLYKTTDGGATWTCIKSVSEFTGCNNIALDPDNPEIIYAAFHQRMRKVYTYIGGGPESALYKSTDGGATWKKLEGGLPSGDIGRIGLAVSPVKGNYVYAVVEAYESKGGIYRSTDRGASWTKMSGNYYSGNYYNEVDCDPVDADKIYITDTYYKVSYDGGKTVSNLGENNKHIDNHAIWVNPKDGNHMLVGCDGGIYETYDHAKTWHYKENLPVTQFYKVSTDNDYPFYSVHGGTQDNFSLGGPSRSISMNGITNADWYVTSTGDGFETQVDPTDPNIIYAQAQYGALTRFDRRNGEFIYIKPIEGENNAANKWNWDSPLLISQHNHKRLYYGGNKVYRTDDQGNSWVAVSPDLTRQLDRNTFEVMGRVWSVDAIAKNQSTDIFGQTTSIAESKFDENILWVGTDDGLIQLTTDGGKTWNKIDNLPGVPSISYVHQIIASVHEKNTAYVCFNHHRYGDFKPYVLKTTDLGKTWNSVAGDLPERGSVYSVAEDHVDKNLLFAGTEFGCFFTNNGGINWYQIKAGLPTVAVRDIEIQRRENDLVLGTFGRGFYVLDDYSPLRNITKETFAKDAIVFPVKDALMYIESKPLGLRDKGHLGSSYFNTPNPKPGAIFTYFVKEDSKKRKEVRQKEEKDKIEKKEKISYPPIDSLRLEDNEIEPYLLFTIKDANGSVVRNIKTAAKKGMNRIRWDFRTGNHAPVDNRYTPGEDELFGSEDEGYMVAPGSYSVSLSKYKDGELTPLSEEVKFNCNLLMNGSLQSKDLKANTTFYEKVVVLQKDLNKINSTVNSMDKKLKNIDKSVLDMKDGGKDILKRSYDLSRKLIDIKVSLFGDNTRSKREFETPPTVNDRVGTIIYTMWNSTSTVPQMYNDSYAIALKQFNKIKPQVEALEKEVMNLEKAAEQAGAPFLGR